MKDSVHGYIPLEPYVKKLIDTKIFQRLGYVKQLTAAQYVFPNANHTRKEHSIGVGYLANKYAQHLFPNDEYKIKILTIAGLLHDIMHGAWSHAYDSTIYAIIYPGVEKGHDIHRYRAVRELLFDDLKSIGVDPEDIIDVWNGKNNVMGAILKSGLNVDRMDFVNRDTIYTATTHFGTFETDRIIKNTTLGDNYLIYDEKIMSDAIQGLQSRLFMYKEVYLHKTVVAASVLIELMLKEASDYLQLVRKTENLNEFIYLTEGYILNTILHSKDKELSLAKKYAKKLYHRQLPKMIKEDIIYIGDIKHQCGVNINKDGEIIWISRILSNDFSKEFTKYNIHIKTRKLGTIPFEEYWDKKYDNYCVDTYYIKRVYML